MSNLFHRGRANRVVRFGVPGIVLVFLLALVTAAGAATQPVEPDTAYQLSFDAEGETDGGRWVVHLRDAEGNLPFDGALEGEWQTLSAGKKTYVHVFRTPSDVSTCELVLKDAAGQPANVRLEKLDPDTLLINGDFATGNFSGWSEHYNTRMVEIEGRPALRIEQNGYVLTDHVPIPGEGRYSLKGKQGIPWPTVLAYDSQRNLLRSIKLERDRTFVVPEGTASVRALFQTGHDHLPAYRSYEIFNMELTPVDVSEGRPASVEKNRDWEIVLAPNADPREEHAARELRRWMTAITGKAPALLAGPSQGKTRKIFVGRAWAESFADDLKTLEGTDGYAVRTRDGNIHVFGAHPRGALYGVHALLERNTDIIWPRPNPELAAVYSQTPALSFSDADFLSRPVFAKRHISMGGYTMNNPHVFQDWLGRNGLNSPWALHTGNNPLVWQRGAQLGYGGSYMFWLRDAKAEDPNVLPLLDGKRVDNVWRNPCYSYDGTATAIAEHFRKLLKTLPGRDMEHLHATIADNWAVCGCPDCLAPIPLPNGEKLTTDTADSTKNPLFFSTRNFLMLNKVAEDLKKDFPDLKITTHAYIFTAEPPKVPVHPGIIPEYAAYPTQNVRFPILAGKGSRTGNYDEGIWKRRFEKWGEEKKGELGSFGYYYTEGFNALADTAAEDFRALARFDAVQAHTEGFPVDGEEFSTWDADAIEKWSMAKLMWDPSQDPETLRADYIRRVYRGAEREMTAFYKLIRDAWHGAPENVFVNCHTAASDLFRNFILVPGIEEQAKKLLADAEKAATHPVSKAIIQRHRAYFEKLGATLGRVSVPYVEESKNEWLEASSPHWEKAAVVGDFRKVDDWRSFGREEKAGHPTTFRIMHDRENLYLRFDGSDTNPDGQVVPGEPAGIVFPNGDRFEVRLRGGKGREYYLAVGPGGHQYSHPPLGNRWKSVVTRGENSWSAMLAVPLSVLEVRDGENAKVMGRPGRVFRAQGEEREESTHSGAGLFNEHPSFWLNFQIQ